MELNLSSFCMSFRKQVLLLALVFAHASEAWAINCRIRLANIVAAENISPHEKKARLLDPDLVVEKDGAVKATAKDELGLKVKRARLYVRKPEEVEAWLTHISNRLKSVRDGDQPKMAIEEFFALIDGGMTHKDSKFSQIFKDFDIKHIRLVGKKKFKAELSKKAQGEIVLTVPDFPVDDPQAAAIWIKDLYLNLHKAARISISKKMETMKFDEARKEYEFELARLDKEVLGVLNELDAYLMHKNPGEENPLNLASRSLPSLGWYRFASRYSSVNLLAGGGTGALVGKWIADDVGMGIGTAAGLVLGHLTKVKMPIEAWTPNLKVWLKSKDSINIERRRLWDEYVSLHYRHKKVDSVVKKTLKVLASSTIVGMGLYFVLNNRSMVGDSQQGLEDESQNVGKIDELADAQLATLNIDQLTTRYSDLLKTQDLFEEKLKEAERKNDMERAAELNSQIIAIKVYSQKILYKLEALNPDGPAVERANESVNNE